MSLQRSLAIAFLVASAILLALGALVLPWWTGLLGSGSFEIDLRGMRMCMASGCGEAKALAAADSGAHAWAKIGTSTYAASLIAALLLGICALRMLWKDAPKTFTWVSGAFALFAGALGLLFVLLRPESGGWEPTYGVACTLTGALLGASAASLASSAAKSS